MNPILHPVCASNFSGPNRINCLFAEHLAPFLHLPIFALQAQYDSWQIVRVLGSDNPKRVNAFGHTLMDRFRSDFLSFSKNGAFIDSCEHHTQAYNSIVIDGKSAAQALLAWYPREHLKFQFPNQPRFLTDVKRSMYPHPKP